MKSSHLAGGLAALAVLVLLMAAPALADVPSAPDVQTVATAQHYLGTPYKAKGMSAKGVDTASFVKLVYRRSGYWLPWLIRGQARHGVTITRDQVAPGDLVFSADRRRVGVYVGNDTVITMPRRGPVVRYEGTGGWGDDLAYRRYDPSTAYHAARIARKYLGVPYVWGGASPSGFDASGLTMYVYAQLGVAVPHGSTAQQQQSTPLPLSALHRGDLVFFGNAEYSYHVGVYMGGGRMIHAPHTGAVVGYGSIAGSWVGGRLLPPR